jgi:hypothetical protein
MQDALLPHLAPSDIPFGDFLAMLFLALEREGVRPCLLRNYEGFPEENVGGDVDFLIYPDKLAQAFRAVRSILGIRITGYTRRAYVASVFLAGSASKEGSRSLQIDFLWSLSWKRMPFLPTNILLQSAQPRSSGNLNYFVPLPVHEAITSLLMSLLYCGWAKEKYIPKVKHIFAGNRPAAIAALRPQFGLKASSLLVNSVVDGDRQTIHECAIPCRLSLTLLSLLHRPLRSIYWIALYYIRELAIRFSPNNVVTVCILDPDGSKNETVIDNLMPQLVYAAKLQEQCHFSIRPPFMNEPSNMSPENGSHGKAAYGYAVSVVIIVLWLLREWLSQLIGKKNDTLRIFNNYYHDLLIDPIKYRYNGPLWIARLVGKLLPSPDLWVLLDPGMEGAHSNNHNIFSAEAQKMLDTYRSFVKTRKRYIILDAHQSVNTITDWVYAAIVDTLVQRADKLLRNRF